MRKHPLIMATIVAPLLMTALAACGSTGSSGDGDSVASGGGIKATATESAVASDQEQGITFARCMRTNGVNIPDPEAGKAPLVADGPAGSKEHKALEACKQFLADGGQPEKISTADLAKVREYAKCMRANGVDIPDPDADGGMTGKAGGDQAKMAAADKICQSKLPGQQG
jgi:hypothetical protein